MAVAEDHHICIGEMTQYLFLDVAELSGAAHQVFEFFFEITGETEMAVGHANADLLKGEAHAERQMGDEPVAVAAHSMDGGKLTWLRLTHYATDPETQSARAGAMTSIAQQGFSEQILAILKAIPPDSDENIWPVAKCLSGSWAAAHPQESLDILESAVRPGKNKQVGSALRALSRNGADGPVRKRLHNWQ